MDIRIDLAYAGVLAVAAMGHVLPVLSRKSLFFGVTTGSTFKGSDAAGRILRRYRISVWSLTAGVCVVAWAFPHPVALLSGSLLGVALLLAVAHRSTLPFAVAPSSAVEVDLSVSPEKLPGGPVVALLPLLYLLCLSFWAVMHFADLPQKLPVHWGIRGPNRWIETSPQAIIAYLGSHALICIVLVATALGVFRFSRRVNASGLRATQERQFRRGGVLLLLACEYFTVVPPTFALTQAPPIAMNVWLVGFGCVLLAFIIGALIVGQGGARSDKHDDSNTIGDRTTDSRWLWGLLYFNRNDAALFVERRIGVGWTLNFGNPWSWIIILPLAAVLLFRVLRHFS